MEATRAGEFWYAVGLDDATAALAGSIAPT